jgi:hypothetical protein
MHGKGDGNGRIGIPVAESKVGIGTLKGIYILQQVRFACKKNAGSEKKK